MALNGIHVPMYRSRSRNYRWGDGHWGGPPEGFADRAIWGRSPPKTEYFCIPDSQYRVQFRTLIFWICETSVRRNAWLAVLYTYVYRCRCMVMHPFISLDVPVRKCSLTHRGCRTFAFRVHRGQRTSYSSNVHDEMHISSWHWYENATQCKSVTDRHANIGLHTELLYLQHIDLYTALRYCAI